jgi:hypothetical protein
VFLLSNRAADASGAIDKSAPKSFLFGVRGEGELKALESGSLKAEKLPIVVMDHPALKILGDAIGKPLDGIIGYTFFARYRTTIDYQKHEITFVPVKSTAASSPDVSWVRTQRGPHGRRPSPITQARIRVTSLRSRFQGSQHDPLSTTPAVDRSTEALARSPPPGRPTHDWQIANRPSFR